ncbi:lipid II:glycine glycyltransferase FemX [Anaerosolibacter sp.]|uniref:lipid II:glycine glycyltransferase FemX n=1 Tax=Anaerosolibacter sp. TaxID=1872527 RepID=UPI0039F11808
MIYLYETSSEEWNNTLNRLPLDKRDIFFTSEYYKMHELNGEGKGCCFVYEDENGIGIYPFLMNKIEDYNLTQDYYDIETAYGYGGPITSHDGEIFARKFEQAFINFCQNHNIVAEFMRFHPIIENERIFNDNIDIIHNRTIVYLDLNRTIEEIWNEDITSKNRNMIRKAEKSNLTITHNRDFKTFKSIYFETMDKLGADAYYYFSDNYYTMMENDRHYYLMNVMKEDRTIASAVFMKFQKYFHYHLAGSLKEYLKYAPNNFLMWEAIKFAHDSGAKYFHLGGGRTTDMMDPLFKYKSSFSRRTANFYIGKRVHNSRIYEELMSEWQKKNDRKPALFLQYKYR